MPTLTWIGKQAVEKHHLEIPYRLLEYDESLSVGDKKINGGNVLTSKILETLPKHNGSKIIFGEANRISSERLKKENIVFKQIPYEIKVV